MLGDGRYEGRSERVREWMELRTGASGVELMQTDSLSSDCQ